MTMTFIRTAGIVLSLLFAPSVCQADTIGVFLTQPILAASRGSAVTFGGTLSNTTAGTVFLNSAGVNLTGSFSPSDEDTSPFFVNAPLSLGPHGSTSSVDLFTIDVPNSIASGLYAGTFTVLGGVDGNAQDVVGSVNFTLQVGNASTVPEPPTKILVLTGLFLTAALSKGVSFGR